MVYFTLTPIEVMKTLLTLFVCIGMCFSSYAQITAAGDIMFVGVLYDDDDGFSFVALRDITANTTIYFSDKVWNGTSFNSGQGSITWDSGGSLIPAGTVITFENIKTGGPAETVTHGSMSGNISINNQGDRIYAFLGTDDVTPTTFLSAFSNEDIQTNGSTLAGTGLTEGVNVTEFTDGTTWDVLVYNGSTTCNTTVADCAAEIANTANWNTDNSNSDGSPNFPTDVETSFGGTALPVELISFYSKSEAGSIQLFWETASELNNLGFYLEKSLDGARFQELTFIQGHGTSSARHSYSYTEAQSVSVYYRLSQEDFDGAREVIGIVYVQGTSETSIFSVYPNPTSGRVTLKGPITSYNFMDQTGKIILTRDLATTSSASEEISHLLTGAKPGIYFLRAKTNNEEQLIRILRK